PATRWPYVYRPGGGRKIAARRVADYWRPASSAAGGGGVGRVSAQLWLARPRPRGESELPTTSGVTFVPRTRGELQSFADASLSHGLRTSGSPDLENRLCRLLSPSAGSVRPLSAGDPPSSRRRFRRPGSRTTRRRPR